METIKAGCFLFNKEDKKVALVYREKQKDYTFPKGHLEEGEDLKTCAIREVEEETKRKPEIIENIKPFEQRYTTKVGEKCACYMFVAKDIGKSDNSSLDTHDVCWVDFDKVEEVLSYKSLKKEWKKVKKIILREINKE